MPNHVTNKITISAKHADTVLSRIIVDGQFDFSTLVPVQNNVYQGNTTSDDEKDFKRNWYKWNVENWGTKWNAYSTKVIREGDTVSVKFQTAWSVPYPVIAAFCNVFNIPFTLKYCCEGGGWWGIEEYGIDTRLFKENDRVSRLSKKRDYQEHKRDLCVELLGYDPDAEDEENNNG